MEMISATVKVRKGSHFISGWTIPHKSRLRHQAMDPRVGTLSELTEAIHALHRSTLCTGARTAPALSPVAEATGPQG